MILKKCGIVVQVVYLQSELLKTDKITLFAYTIQTVGVARQPATERGKKRQ